MQRRRSPPTVEGTRTPTPKSSGEEANKLDPAQRQILGMLQKDATLSTQQIADKVGLSLSPCWRRVKEMEEAGLIKA